MKTVSKVVCLLATVCILSFFPEVGRAADYNVGNALDFTGPLANVGKSLDNRSLLNGGMRPRDPSWE